MKKRFTVIPIVAFTVFTMYSQNINERAALITNAFGYLQGQQYYIELIKSNSPAYSSEAHIGEKEFNKSFSQAIYRIVKEMKLIYGSNYDSFLTNFNTNLKVKLEGKDKLTDNNISLFIDLVKERANGKIESPVLETLLAYQYFDFPEMEMLDGFTKTYETTTYTQNRKYTTQIELPVSWKEIDLKGGKALRKFRSVYGVGNEVLSLEIKNFHNSDLKKSSKEFISEEQLKNMIVANATNVSIQDDLLNGITFKKIMYQEKNNLKSRFSTLYVTVIDQTLIKAKFMVYNTSNLIQTDRPKFHALFSQIMSSVKIYEKDKKTKMVTYNN